MTLTEWAALCPEDVAAFICPPEGGQIIMLPKNPSDDEDMPPYVMPVVYLATLLNERNSDLLDQLKIRIRRDVHGNGNAGTL